MNALPAHMYVQHNMLNSLRQGLSWNLLTDWLDWPAGKPPPPHAPGSALEC